MKLRKKTKIIITILGIVAGLGLSGCTSTVSNNESKSSPSSTHSSSETSILESIDVSDYEALATEFLEPVFLSNISSTSWWQTSEINPDNLIMFYLAKNKLNNIDNPSFEATIVEDFVKTYFDISSEYLRTSSYYNKETSAYKFADLGSSENYKIVDANLSNRDLSISYEVYSPTDDTTVIRGGRVSIIVLLNSYRYVAHSSHEAYIINTDVNVDVSDYEALAKEFLSPACVSSIAASTWTNAEELRPDTLAVFYLAKKGYIPNYNVNEQEVEQLIQSYFDVSSEHLRKSSYYNKDTSTYDLIGLGSPLLTKIIEAKLDGDILSISHEAYSRTDDITVVRTGVLQIKLEENSYKYISSAVKGID